MCVYVSTTPHPPVERRTEEALSIILVLEDLRAVSLCVFICDVGAPFFEGEGLVGVLHVCVDVGGCFLGVCVCVFLGVQPLRPLVEVVATGVSERVVCECVCDCCASFLATTCPLLPPGK